MKATHQTLAAAVSLIGSLTVISDARADAKQTCAAAYQNTQILREQGKLVEAREQAVVCSASTCSTYATTDCMRWLTEIDASLPSVVIVAEDTAGADTLAVRVLVDGRVLADKLDGRALAMNPGEYTIRFELAGAPPIEQNVVIRQGEKNRKLTVSFKQGPQPSKAPAPVPPQPLSTVPVWAWVSGGVGIAALGGAAGFGVAALRAQSTLIDKCGGDPARCPSKLDAETKPIAADRDRDRNVFIGLGIAGLLGIGVAVVGIALAPSTDANAKTSLGGWCFSLTSRARL